MTRGARLAVPRHRPAPRARHPDRGPRCARRSSGDAAQPESRRLEQRARGGRQRDDLPLALSDLAQVPLVLDLLLRRRGESALARVPARAARRAASRPAEARAAPRRAGAPRARARRPDRRARERRSAAARRARPTLLDAIAHALPALADALNHAYLVHAVPRAATRRQDVVTAYHVEHETRVRATPSEVVSSHNEAHLAPARAPLPGARSLAMLRSTRCPRRVRWTPRLLRQRRASSSSSRAAPRARDPRESEVERGAAPALRSGALAGLGGGRVRRSAGRSARPARGVRVRVRLAVRRRRAGARRLCAAVVRRGPPARRRRCSTSAHRIHARVPLRPGGHARSTRRVEDALRERHGVCQDFAHVMIGGLRSLGLPARYVSGYVRTRRADAPAPDGELVGSEASHAWVVGLVSRARLDRGRSDQRRRCRATGTSCSRWAATTTTSRPVKGVTLGGGTQRLAVRVELVETR